MNIANRIASAAVTITLFAASSQAQADQGRAVSLKMLAHTLKNGTSKQALMLCGITRLSGFVIDPKSKDIILIGKVDPSYPGLQTDDFVVALRYAHMIYAKREGNVRYYTPPGCSIDPDPKIIQQLRQVGRGRESGDGDRKATAKQWESIGRQPQKVRVLGVPFDTHFAKVMVDADYYMKRLSNGSVDLSIDGFTGLMPMHIAQAKANLFSETLLTEPQHSLNRFWFCPGEATYEEDEGLLLLRNCQVKLLSEEEYLTSVGEIQGLGRASPIAQRFAESFTTKYHKIAAVRPVYKELEALFRFTALANLIKEKNALSRSGNPLLYLLSQHKIKNVPVSRMVPGQTRVLEVQDKKQTSNGSEVRYITLMSCGGVNMNIRPKRIISRSSERGGKRVTKPQASLRNRVLTNRASRNSLYWDFAMPD